MSTITATLPRTCAECKKPSRYFLGGLAYCAGHGPHAWACPQCGALEHWTDVSSTRQCATCTPETLLSDQIGAVLVSFAEVTAPAATALWRALAALVEANREDDDALTAAEALVTLTAHGGDEVEISAALGERNAIQRRQQDRKHQAGILIDALRTAAAAPNQRIDPGLIARFRARLSG